MESAPPGMHIKLEGLRKSLRTHAVLQGIDVECILQRVMGKHESHRDKEAIAFSTSH